MSTSLHEQIKWSRNAPRFILRLTASDYLLSFTGRSLPAHPGCEFLTQSFNFKVSCALLLSYYACEMSRLTVLKDLSHISRQRLCNSTSKQQTPEPELPPASAHSVVFLILISIDDHAPPVLPRFIRPRISESFAIPTMVPLLPICLELPAFLASAIYVFVLPNKLTSTAFFPRSQQYGWPSITTLDTPQNIPIRLLRTPHPRHRHSIATLRRGCLFYP